MDEDGIIDKIKDLINENNYKDDQEELKSFIFEEIKHRKKLDDLKRSVSEKWKKPLNNLEHDYIDRKFIKYCTQFWLDDVHQIVTNEIKNKKSQNVLMSLKQVKEIKNVPKLFQSSDYYKILILQSNLLDESLEAVLVHKIKTICLEQTIKHNTTAKKELEFIGCIASFIDTNYNNKNILKKLNLQGFLKGEVTFEVLLNTVIQLNSTEIGKTDTDTITLIKSAESLQSEKNFTMLKKFEEILRDFLKPVKVHTKVIDDRTIIEIKSRNLKVSEILNDIESIIIKDSNIVEIQFIVYKNFYIDMDLNNDIWHGKNIGILARDIHVIKNISWDVSGKNNDHKYESDSGTDTDGCGKAGSDGYPGESGGNVSIFSKNVFNKELFVLLSNGGNGSDGQNGGNGKDGPDGQGISRSEFKIKFPSVIKFASSMWERTKKVKEIIKYIKDLASTTHCEWYTNNYDAGEWDVFLEVTTHQGNHITFSYCRGGLTRRYQGFLLYKGSLGKPGKSGGKNGLGGEGGFPGTIEVKHMQNQQEFKIQKHSNPGVKGKAGKVGSHGKHGKNSWDMGYIDYQFWGETVVYDSRDNNINIVYYENNSPDRVWCPYKAEYNRFSFAEMEVQRIKHPQQMTYESNERTEDNSDRQHFAKANKKKNVLATNLCNDYLIINSDESNNYKDLNSQFQERDLLTTDAFSAYNYYNLQNHNAEVRSSTNRILNYKISNKNEKVIEQKNLASEFKISKESTTLEIIPSIFINLTNPETFVENVPSLKRITVNLNNLNQIYKNWTKCKSKLRKLSDYENVEVVFIEKYRIAVLQDIAKKVNIFEKQIFFSKDCKNELSADQAIKYLTCRNKKFTDVHHDELGSFRQYIFENEEMHRENVIKICKNGLIQTHKEAFGQVFAKYLLEIPENDRHNKSIKKYFDEYNLFLNEKKLKISKHYNIFKSELFKYRHKSILQTMLNKTIDECTANDLKNKIENDQFLKILYKRFHEQFQLTYDWENICEDKKFLDVFFSFVEHQGPKTSCYREILAHIFNINIRIYTANNEKIFTLLDNHNGSSSNIIYFLYNDGKFLEIDINSEYLNLNKNRENMDNIFFKILSDIYALNSTNTLLEYFENFDVTLNKQDVQLYRKRQENLNEEKEIDEISEFFSIYEREQIKSNLQKIASNLIGHSGIIHIILRRFQYEGRYVSIKEIRYLVNVILSSHLNNEKLENKISWIIATVNQSNWIAELILIELESFFKKRLDKTSEIQMYLTKINPDILIIFGVKLCKYQQQNVFISSLYVEDTLYLLSNIEDAYTNLEHIELSEWPYILKEYYWMNKINKINKLFKWNRSVPYYILSLDNMLGMSVISEFLDVLASKNIIKTQNINTFDDILQNFVDERWNLGIEEMNQLRSTNSLSEWVAILDDKFYASNTERNGKQLVNLIKGNSNTSKNILELLPKILKILYNVNDNKYFVDNVDVRNMTENDIIKYAQQIQSYKKKDIKFEQLLGVINRAIELKRNFQLRDTQKLTIMSLLLNENNTLAQVSTGEGKSLIVVAISIMKALNGEKVDIVTSSSVLAIRDAVINKDLYDLFNVSVGHNCSEVIKNRKETYSTSKVIYGDLSNFQRDYLLDRFYGENILGDHDFCNIIIDEVDSMLLDKGNNTIYLSHDIAGLDKLESVYVYIWCSVNRPIQDATNVSEFMNISKIKESILSDMFGIIKKSDIEKLDREIDEIKKMKIWNFLVNNEIIERNGRLIAQNMSNVNLDKLPTDLINLKDQIMYILRECIERQRFIYVPKYLNHFIEKHLESWIESAFAAFYMIAGHDYVVDVDRTKTISDGNPIITIIDRATGTDQISAQWDNALHQFLQLKHGCKLTMQSLKAVFISNVSYFKLYRKLYGLTGTLGSERERNLLKEVHMVDFVTVPTAKSKQFHECIPIVCKNKEIWIKNIHNEVETVVYKEMRSILIICQYVEDVELIQKNLTNKGIQNIYTYTRDYEEFDIARGTKKLQRSQIIIATNLAGRGTDIILTEQLRANGGLHVCLTYLPTNTRIERQAFGRAARSGDKGTGRLIFVDGSYEGSITSKVWNLKKERDLEEVNRISSINVEYNNKIRIEEKCFDKFKKLFEKIKNHLTISNIAPEVKSILLQCCLDNWAFWLDEKTCDKFTEDIYYGNLNESSKLFYDHLENITCDLTCVGVSEFNKQKCYDLVKQNPIAMVILGKYFLTQNNFEQALVLFNTVINNEPNFSEAAYYYKAFTISKQINWEYLETVPQIRLLVPFAPDITKNKRKLFKDALLKSAKLFKDQAERLLYNATMIDKIKENYPDSIIQIEAYTQQQQIFSNFYNMFVKSIDDIVGNPVTYQNFSSIDINEQQAQDVYDKLLEEGFLNQTKLKKSVNEMQLEPICRDFSISSKVLHSFLDKYKNQYFDVKVFIKDLKNHIHLPSCGNFWSILLEQGIIFKEVKYVIVDEIILHKIDPSFMDLLTKKISSGNIRTFDDIPFNDSDSTKTIFISGICIKEQKNKNNLILYKNELKSLNPSKYSILKKKGALTFNKMAYIDTTKITGANFEQHDSIVLEDFNKIKIYKEQATELLSELSSEGIIEEKRKNKNQFVYKLKVQYEKIFEIKIKSREIYKSNVIGLLLSCFAYRIAIQKLQRQLIEKEQNICIQLMTKPHYGLFYELIEQNIIKNVKVTNKRTITEECVKNVFGLPISKEKFIQMLNKSDIVPIGKAPELFDDLVRANWLKHCNVFGQVLHGKVFEVTPFDGNQQALNEDFQPFQESLKIFLNHKSMLGNENSIRSLTKTLNQLKSSIKSLSVPDNTLKPLTELCGSNKFSNVDELHIMSLNGLDHIQQFEEKKHTTKMLISTAVVFGLGLIQLAVGVIILYYSMGFMTHIGSILISEGISDMLYSTSAYRSGYFSWNDYLNHKIKSLIFSAITVGVGAIFSWGVRYSRFGYKLFGPALQNTCGKELVKKTGTMAIVKSISIEALKGISTCAANYGADALIDRHLKSFCENVGSAIRTNIETQVDSDTLSSRLETVYKIYGSSKAKKALSEMTDTFFHNHNIGSNILPTAMRISNSIVKGVKEAANKKNLGGSRTLFVINIIGKMLVWSNRARDLYMIKNITEHFIDNLCKEIDEKLIKTKDVQESSSEDGKFCQEEYYDFKKEITENWKHILRQQSGRVISQNIISPILEDCLHELIMFCGKKIKDIHRFTKEKSLEAKLRELRQQFKKDLTKAKTKLATAGTETEKSITNKYHADVLKLLAETKNPHLFAAMILENIPMDLTCALTSGPVIEAVLKERGIVKPGLSIVFNTTEGIKHEVLIGPKSANKQTIVLELKDNHYQISGINNSSNSNLESAQNDCLYQALAEVIPELSELGPNNFRTAMAKQIIENPEIQCHIENGWHKYPIRLKLYGGAKKINNRRRVSRREDPDSTEQSDLIKDPAVHLYDRFIRFFRFAGTVQRISTDIAVPRENVAREGASEYQDRNSKLGYEYHSSHIIRAVIDTSVDPQRHAEAFVELRNILGHTQIVPRFANEYHGIGGVIDDIQGDALLMTSSCNFSSNLRSNREILNGVKNMFVNSIKDFLKDSDRLTESNRRDIERSLERISKTSPREMYESGRDGFFKGKYRDAYM